MATVISPNMNLPVPVAGSEPGPLWATDLNNCMSSIDSHDHSAGKGVQITPSGLNINSDLPFANNNATGVRTVRFQANPSLGASDLSAAYVNGVDLYYIDGNGNQVRLTQSGAVAGTPGSIANLVSPASASYVSANSKFVWQSAANTAADTDTRNVILRNGTANSKGLTLQPPNAMAADYSITLPTVPLATNIVTMDASGNFGTTLNVDTSTLQISGNLISVIASVLTPPGTISAYGGTSAPTGYLLCDGTSYLRSAYSALFGVIGTAYGTADGSHFNVPDLRGQFLRGVTGSSSNDPDASSRTAMATGGNTGNNVGSIQVDSLKSHTHTLAEFASVQPSGGPYSSYNTQTGTSTVTGATGGNETRPINAYVNFIIKT